jgi:hypothetical protein
VNVNSRPPDHYGILELTPEASDAEIKKRYRQIMREVHPDANGGDPGATRAAARVNAAFETLGDPEKRRVYDEIHHPKRANKRYEVWAEQPNWEDIVAANVPTPKRQKHVHIEEPLIEPEEIEVDMAELRQYARVRRSIKLTNRCNCTITGDVSTSEPWVWGPVGKLRAGPGESIEFEVEIVARKVTFPGISRVIFVARDWTGVIPVKITGYQPKQRRTVTPASGAYVPLRRRKWSGRR